VAKPSVQSKRGLQQGRGRVRKAQILCRALCRVEGMKTVVGGGEHGGDWICGTWGESLGCLGLELWHAGGGLPSRCPFVSVFLLQICACFPRSFFAFFTSSSVVTLAIFTLICSLHRHPLVLYASICRRRHLRRAAAGARRLFVWGPSTPSSPTASSASPHTSPPLPHRSSLLAASD
jgi:hypothetical protein